MGRLFILILTALFSLSLYAETAKPACSKNMTSLFKIPLLCADRSVLDKAIKERGGIPKRINHKILSNTYKSSRLLRGSHYLEMAYTKGDRFSQAKYTFQSFMDRWQVERVKFLLSSKYGEPDEFRGKLKIGKVEYKWKLKDGIVLKVYRGWPDTTTYVTYENPPTH